MRHPTEGVLRRLLDEPAGVADADRDHVAGCDECRGRLTVVRDDAELVHAALAGPGEGASGDIDVDAAWQRLSTAASASASPAAGRVRVAAPFRARRFRDARRRPAVAGVAVAAVLAVAGTAAANDWLPIFRTEEITSISLHPEDLNALPDLSAYGELEVTGDPGMHTVPDAAAAAAATGLDVPELTDLPRGVTGAPTYQVGDEVSATFTFSADRAARAARAAAGGGEELPPLPPGLDGSQVRLVAGPGVAAIWSPSSRSGSAGVPDLVVGRAVAPTAFSSGVAFETVRAYLLSLPGLPDDVAAGLRTLNADAGTLPVPVPAEQVTTSTAEVGGETATVIATRDRTGAAVVWVDGGIMTVVAGSLDVDEVLALARSLS
jgi:hypothetical protein